MPDGGVKRTILRVTPTKANIQTIKSMATVLSNGGRVEISTRESTDMMIEKDLER